MIKAEQIIQGKSSSNNILPFHFPLSSCLQFSQRSRMI